MDLISSRVYVSPGLSAIQFLSAIETMLSWLNAAERCGYNWRGWILCAAHLVICVFELFPLVSSELLLLIILLEVVRLSAVNIYTHFLFSFSLLLFVQFLFVFILVFMMIIMIVKCTQDVNKRILHFTFSPLPENVNSVCLHEIRMSFDWSTKPNTSSDAVGVTKEIILK